MNSARGAILLAALLAIPLAAATAVARDLETGRYAAYLVTVVCGE